jgi:hypothetical protein
MPENERILEHVLDYIHRYYGGTQAAYIVACALRDCRESRIMAQLGKQNVGKLMQCIVARIQKRTEVRPMPEDIKEPISFKTHIAKAIY